MEATEVRADYVVPAKKEYEKPAEGQHALVLVDLKDLGQVTQTFKGETKTQPKVRLIFKVTDQVAKDGTDLLIFKQYTASMHVKADLYKLLLSFGIAPDPKAGFNLNSIIGTKFTAEIEYNQSKDGLTTYANLGPVVRRTVVLPAAFRKKTVAPAVDLLAEAAVQAQEF